nr:MAG TPA: hypothetical protein [Caudoviricetes sp.]
MKKEIVKDNISQEERYKAIAFYLVKLHRVRPEALKQGKTEAEADAMALSTVDYMAENLSAKVYADYKKACTRKQK